MQSMRDIKHRIRSVQNISKITKAMQMVAAAKLRRAQERAIAARPYAEKMRDVIANVASGVTNKKHPILEQREIKRTGYLVITSDRGLAGGYNANVIRHLIKNIESRHRSREEYVLFIIGRKGMEYFKRRDYPVIDTMTGLSDSPEYHDIKPIATKAIDMFAAAEFDQLYLYYNRFINPITQRPEEKLILPLADVATTKGEDQAAKANLSFDFEPSDEEVLVALLPKYAETLIYSAMLDAKASEFGAKMTAMSNASDNASELIETLTLQFNRARQAAVTQEIAEIVAGANALS